MVPITTEDVAIFTAGFEDGDGSTTREICVNQLHPDKSITVAQERQIARALMAATNALERGQFGEVTATAV